MQEIQLTKGKVALVDDEDYAELSKFKWYFNNGYAQRNQHIGMVDGKQKTRKVYMHREITGNNTKLFTDHIDGDTLNNTRKNLRLCNNAENQMNKVRSSSNKSGYKGVYWHEGNKKWMAVIGIRVNGSGRMKHLGAFDTALEAAECYNTAAKKTFKEFARIN